MQGKFLQRQPEEDEELLQGKFETGRIQRQEDEEDLLQGKFLQPFDGLRVNRQSEDEEELLQGKMEPVGLQRQFPEKEPLQMETNSYGIDAEGGILESGLETSIKRSKGRGHPLPVNLRNKMENAFNSDFTKVKVHNSSESDMLNQQIKARAFTTGHDIFLKEGEYDVGSSRGLELLAHELTHVMQQTSSPLGLASSQRQRSAHYPISKGTKFVQRTIPELFGRIFGGKKKMDEEEDLQSKSPRSFQKTIPEKFGKKHGDKLKTVEEAAELIESQAVETGTGLGELVVHSTTQHPDKHSEPLQGEGATFLSFFKSLIGMGGLYHNFVKLLKSRTKQKAGSELEKEAGWQEEKEAAANLGTGVVGVTGDIFGTAEGVGKWIGQGASTGVKTVGAAAGIIGAVGSGIDFLKKMAGSIKSSAKLGKLLAFLAWLKKPQKDRYKGVEDTKGLKEIASFAGKRTFRSVISQYGGAVGAGMGTVGSVLLVLSGLFPALASLGPVGWGLALAGGIIGSGIALIKLAKGSWKRSHQRYKLRKVEEALDEKIKLSGKEDDQDTKTSKKPWYTRAGHKIVSGWQWITGKDIKKRRAAVKERFEGLLPEEKKEIRDKVRFEVVRAYKTKEERMAERLVERLAKKPGGISQELAKIIGVVNRKGKVIRSRGWKFWRKKEDLDLKKIIEKKSNKEALIDLWKEKF